MTGSYSYTPYGSATHSGTDTTCLQYTGQYTDPESGLVYLRARYYDPSTAEFLTVDPDVFETGAPYAYTGDDPLNATDLTGLCWALFQWACDAASAVGNAASDAYNWVKNFSTSGLNWIFNIFAQTNPPAGVKPGWQARIANNGKGTVWQEPGVQGNANSLRVMDPTPRYQYGYVRFYNKHGQPIGLNGKPGPQADTHIPCNSDGSYPLPAGW